jgi:hypothetical protein
VSSDPPIIKEGGSCEGKNYCGYEGFPIGDQKNL